MRTKSIGIALGLATVVLVIRPAASQEPDLRPSNFVEDVTNAGTSAAAFLQIGVGARAQAMGNAGTTSARDATALFWNPATVVEIDGAVNVAFDHTNWLVDTSLDYFGAVFRLSGIGSLGFGIMSFQAVDEQPVRTISQPEGTGETYSASDLVLSATYAASLTDRFSAGLTGKYVRESLWNESASTVAFDLGIMYRTKLQGLRLAASIANFGGDMRLEGRDLIRPFDEDPNNFSNDQLNVRLETDKFSLPLAFRFGIEYELTASNRHRLNLAADLLNPSDNSQSVNVGAEYTFWETISFRGGMSSLFERDRTGGATFGLGVQRKLLEGLRLSADYAYADWGILDGTHRITLAVSR